MITARGAFAGENARSSRFGYRKDVDGLRGLAVLAVLGYHGFSRFVPGGYVGVDIFFVISGFLISGIILSNLERDGFSFVDFYARRIRRIFPALCLVLVAVLAFGWFALLSNEYRRLGLHVAGGAGFISNFVLWGESGYFDAGAESKPLLHLWSLGIEEQFYIVWPLLLWSIWKQRLNTWFIYALVIGASFATSVVVLHVNPTAAFYSPVCRFWELICGAFLAYMTLHEPPWWTRLGSRADAVLRRVLVRSSRSPSGEFWADTKASVGLVGVIIALAMLNKRSMFPGWHAWFPVGGACLILSAGEDAWINRVIFANPVSVWFGLISYPLYLWHWPILSLARIVAGGVPPPVARAGFLALSILLAWLTYTLVEKPIRFGRQGGVKAVAFAILMSMTCALGVLIYCRSGLPLRKVNREFGANQQQLSWFEPSPQCLKLIGLESEYRTKQGIFCSFSGEPENIRFAILGDSTANALYPGFAKVLGERGIGVIDLGCGTCTPFRGHEGSFTWNRRCREINDRIYDYVLRNPNIKLVLLGLAPWDFQNMIFDKLAANAPIPAKFRAMAHLADRDVKVLAAAGKEVVITFDSPHLGRDPSGCLPRPFRKSRRTCALSENELALREPFVAMWRSFAEKRSDLCVFEQSPSLRIGGLYSFLDESGTLMYRDDHHLS